MDLTPKEIADLDAKYADLSTDMGKVVLKSNQKGSKLDGYRENDSVSAEYAEAFGVGW